MAVLAMRQPAEMHGMKIGRKPKLTPQHIDKGKRREDVAALLRVK